MSEYHSIEWKDGMLRMLDQRQLPHTVVYLDYRDPGEVAQAIKDMVIRGAPAIGVAAAYGLALAPYQYPSAGVQEALQKLDEAAAVLCASRPTAVNLSYALERVLARVRLAQPDSLEALRQLVLNEAEAIAAEDAWINRNIGVNALPLVPQKAVFIHHCNTGGLATSAYGTALGIIRAAHEHGRPVFVYVDETRPRLQGALLTAWELGQLGIPHAVIVDGASGYIMKTRQVDLVTVGCDRVAANGDTANKIGTYNLAVVAHAHGVPFYVAAPTTTIDLSLDSGEQIIIEERDGAEVARIGSERLLPEGTQVVNPAFDVTPAEYITAMITEEGIAYPPYRESLAQLVAKAEIRRQGAGLPPAARP
jgi:methylthioribose-1-phosphate isomerase